MKNTRRILRQVRRNNIAVIWNHFEEKVELYDIPKRQRSAFFRSRRNRVQMENAVKFMNNPSVNPVTGGPFTKRLGKKLFTKPN